MPVFELIDRAAGPLAFAELQTRPVRVVLAVIAVALFVLVSGAAHAEEALIGGFHTGNDLYRWCNYDYGSDSVCLAYIVAGAEALSL
jgi:hypothetical protein